MNLQPTNESDAPSQPRYTIAGRVIPVVEAMQQSIARASGQPLTEARRSEGLPVWCHNIADRLTKTVFKRVVGLSPQGQFNARNYGRLLGLFLRAAVFYFKEAPKKLKQEGLLDLSKEQEEKIAAHSGMNLVYALASEKLGRPVTNEDQLVDEVMAQGEKKVEEHMGHVVNVLKYLFEQTSIETMHEFLCGLPEGFVLFLDDKGKFAGDRRRTEVYLALLTFWPEIEDMQRAQPPKTRKDLLEWLEKQEGRQFFEDPKTFYELCGQIDLDLAPPGHPVGVSPA